jgi:thiosulfate/3-mercaptopyruvate sulfurtransferase
MARWLNILLGLVITAAALPAAAVDDIEGRLVSPQWLERNLHSTGLLLLDASSPPQYAAGHIPGAVSASALAPVGRGMPVAAMQGLLSAWGVSPGQRIVVYDEGGSWMAARLFHDLAYHGVPTADLYLLDGGLHQWKASGRPVTTQATPAPAAGSFRITRVNEALRVRLPEFLGATGDTAGHVVVDALEPAYYYGGAQFFDRAGHVPNARLWPASDFFAADKTFKSREEIRRMLAHHGIEPAQTVHVYCGGGGAAAVPVFALRELLGRDHVKLYDGSQREWLADERGLPLRTYPAPQLLRPARWLATWGSTMLRRFGLASLSVIDLRTPQAYAQGHVPYALNVPAAVFRALADQPARLAGQLGAAGVDIGHEAVIIGSGRGLTPDAALAWWLLQELGQRKVSLLAEGFDEWALAGMSVVKEATTVGPPRSPRDMAVPATAYAYAPRDRAAAADDSAYPRVYVAAGRQAPARPPAGAAAQARLVHLPSTELLDAAGMPKPAADLWNLLAKAGVPRYARIVVFADDAGEAALNALVLKLMGFVDVQLAAAAS